MDSMIASANTEAINKLLIKRTNPEPIYVLALSILACIIVFVMYIHLYVRSFICGQWINRVNSKRYVLGIQFLSIIATSVESAQKKSYSYILGILRRGDEVGVAMGYDTIKWINGEIWEKEKSINVPQ